MQPEPERRFRGRIGIVGAGRLGSALARGLLAAGYRVAFVSSLHGNSAAAVARGLGDTVAAVTTQELARASDLVFVAVPDSAIERLAGGLPWRQGQAAVHCSGALGLNVLEVAAGASALRGCLHPLQSFSSGAGEPARFRGIACGIEGAEPLGGWLEQMALDLGGRPFRLEGVDRALYHAAAVFSSNYVVALMAAATRAWEGAGLAPEEARAALAPLLLGAAGNIEEQPLAEALTGPVARGDSLTVERHLRALEAWPDLRSLYSALALELLRLPLELPADSRARLESLLAGRPS